MNKFFHNKYTLNNFISIKIKINKKYLYIIVMYKNKIDYVRLMKTATNAIMTTGSKQYPNMDMVLYNSIFLFWLRRFMML
jgi:hypothetical protein